MLDAKKGETRDHPWRLIVRVVRQNVVGMQGELVAGRTKMEMKVES
jgi:hypothetical protein